MDVVKPFPTDEPIRPEARLIGRAATLDALTRQVLEQRTHTRISADRREGKTSVALALLDRARARDDYWALEADLSKSGPLRTAAALADHLAEQARAARVGVTAGTGLSKLRQAARSSAKVAKAGRLLGLDDVENVGRVGEAIDALLTPSESPSADHLHATFAAIEAAALAADRGVVVLIDEAHRLVTNWHDDEDAELVADVLGEVMKRPDGRTVLLVAGSEERVMEGMFAPGKPLEYLGTTFELPDIGREDWLAGLKARFAEVQLTISDDQLVKILERTGGRPQLTMRVCARVRAYSADAPDDVVTELAVENGIREGLAE
jgi:hypothetical protein